MRKTTILTTMLTSLMGLAAFADDTDISSLENAVYIESGLTVTINTDGEAVIPIKMKNNVGATGYQFNAVLPSRLSKSDVTFKKSAARKSEEVAYSGAYQTDGSYKAVAYTSDDLEFSGNDGEIVTMTIANATAGTYEFTIASGSITSHGTSYKASVDVVSTVTIKEESYEEGYSVQIAPFAFAEDIDGLEFVLGAKTSLTNVSFDIAFPTNIGTNQLYTISKALGTTTATTSIDDDEQGNVSVSIARKSTKTIADGATIAKLELGYDEDVLTAGVYELKITNIKMTDTDGNEYSAAPYSASIFIGESPKASVVDGKVTVAGDFAEDASLLTAALPTTDATVTTVDLTGVTALPAGTTITTANTNALIMTSADLGLANTKNVVIGNTCAELEITDGNAFATTKKFTATTASYTRSMDYTFNDITTRCSFGTVYLPYEVKSGASIQYYQLKGVSSSKMTFEPVESVPANTPAVFKVSGASANITEENVSVVAGDKEWSETINDCTWTMKGTMVDLTKDPASVSGNIYYIAEDKFWYANQSFEVKPFRAWFETTQTVSPSGSPLRINIEGEETNGIQYVEQEDGTVDVIFDLEGRKLNAPKNGINIINNKKILVK